MALFSQDDSDDETPTMGAAFSGGPNPDEPDDETATPSPADGDEQQQAPVPDDSSAYAQSQDSEEQPNQSSAPSEDEEGGDYSQSAAPSGASVLPSMPVLADNSANQAELEYAKSHFNPSDYKPSIGRKILAGLSGGAIAFGTRNIPAALNAEQGVLNDPLQRAQAVEAQKESAINQRIADVNSQNQTRQATYQNQRVAANDAALNDQRSQRAQDYAAQAAARSNAIVQFTPKDPNNPYAGGTGVTAGGKTVENVAPPDKWLTNWERDPANKAKADAERGVQTLKALEASGVKLTPEQRAIVASGGKVTPSSRTTIEIKENPDGSAITPKGSTPLDTDALIQQHLADKQSFADGWQRVDAAHAGPGVPEGSYVAADTDLADVKTGDFKPSKNNFLTGQQFNDKIDGFRTKLNASPAMRKAGTMLDDQGNVIGNRFAPPAQQQAQPTAPPPAAAPKTFDRTLIPKNIPLPPNSVWVKAPNGAIGHIPSANLQKAIAKGYAVPGGQ